MITIYTSVRNPLYFLIIKLYKVILYYTIHEHIHTNNIITKKKIMHILHTHKLHYIYTIHEHIQFLIL